jgi:hypothetical protein
MSGDRIAAMADPIVFPDGMFTDPTKKFDRTIKLDFRACRVVCTHSQGVKDAPEVLLELRHSGPVTVDAFANIYGDRAPFHSWNLDTRDALVSELGVSAPTWGRPNARDPLLAKVDLACGTGRCGRNDLVAHLKLLRVLDFAVETNGVTGLDGARELTNGELFAALGRLGAAHSGHKDAYWGDVVATYHLIDQAIDGELVARNQARLTEWRKLNPNRASRKTPQPSP